MLTLIYPQISRTLVSIGPFAIRWYALAYIAGIVLGWLYAGWLIKRQPIFMTKKQLEDFVVWVTLGIILGGRLGYVLFYQPEKYLSSPLDIIRVWQGGMSSHGGMIGVTLAILLFARRNKLPQFQLSDVIALVVPIGLGLGRLANFINDELWGRVTDAPWGMVFPGAGPLPRHPSQLYEAVLEGGLLLASLYVLERRGARVRPGLITGNFLVLYGIFRCFSEYFREPDSFLGFFWHGHLTMGQILSLPLIAFGGYLIVRAYRNMPMTASPETVRAA